MARPVPERQPDASAGPFVLTGGQDNLPHLRRARCPLAFAVQADSDRPLVSCGWIFNDRCLIRLASNALNVRFGSRLRENAVTRSAIARDRLSVARHG